MISIILHFHFLVLMQNQLFLHQILVIMSIFIISYFMSLLRGSFVFLSAFCCYTFHMSHCFVTSPMLLTFFGFFLDDTAETVLIDDARAMKKIRTAFVAVSLNLRVYRWRWALLQNVTHLNTLCHMY